MLITTKSCSALIKAGLPKNERGSVVVYRLNEIMDNIKLDPDVQGAHIDAFIVSTEDIKSRILSDKFIEASNHKHQDVRIILIDRNGKYILPTNAQSIDKVLVKPTAQALVDTIYSVASKLSSKPIVESAMNRAQALNPKDERVDLDAMFNMSMPNTRQSESIPDIESDEDVEITYDELEQLNPTEYQEEPTKVKSNNSIASRVAKTNTIADVSVLLNEISRGSVIEELANDMAAYQAAETRIEILSNDIQDLMRDPTTPLLSDKLKKLKVIIRDKKDWEAQSYSMIEDYIQEIVSAVVNSVSSMLDDELRDVKITCDKIAAQETGAQSIGRIGLLNETRTKTIMEISMCKQRLDEIGTKLVALSAETIATISQESRVLTDSPLADNAIILSTGGKQIYGKGIREIISSIATIGIDAGDEFNKYISEVDKLYNYYNELVQTDKEQLAQYAEAVKWFSARNIEDTVIANTLLKKTMRIYTGREGCGRTIIPYVISKRKSAEGNNNTLLIDLTGTSKYSTYGIKAVLLDDYIRTRNEESFLVIEGVVRTYEEMAKMNAVLTRAADYYKVINMVLPEDKELFDMFSSNALSCTYITDTNISNMRYTKIMMESYKLSNVAQRLIVNKNIIATSRIIELFELQDRLDVQVMTMPHLQSIVACQFDGNDPSAMSYVMECVKECVKYA